MKWLKNLVRFVCEVFKKKEEFSEPPRNDDDAEYKEMHWMYGGFRGQGAVRCDDAVIGDLSVKSNGLSYRWVSGGCEALGANGAHNASETLACLFCLINGKWVGGKFDWISTSRTTRDFHNIATGYNGWDSCAIDKAEAYRFVIVSKDGSKRTNIIEVAR